MEGLSNNNFSAEPGGNLRWRERYLGEDYSRKMVQEVQKAKFSKWWKWEKDYGLGAQEWGRNRGGHTRISRAEYANNFKDGFYFKLDGKVIKWLSARVTKSFDCCVKMYWRQSGVERGRMTGNLELQSKWEMPRATSNVGSRAGEMGTKEVFLCFCGWKDKIQNLQWEDITGFALPHLI